LSNVPLDQASLLAQRAVRNAEQAVATLDKLAPMVEGAVIVAENAATVITAEREAPLKVLQEELVRTIQFAHEERVAAINADRQTVKLR